MNNLIFNAAAVPDEKLYSIEVSVFSFTFSDSKRIKRKRNLILLSRLRKVNIISEFLIKCVSLLRNSLVYKAT